MNQEAIAQIRRSIEGFRLPRYDEIPDVGLYLEQTTKFIAEALAPILSDDVTGTMISNYVKRGVVSSPVKKQYSREQIAYLIYALCTKKVLSLENIKLTISVQRQSYTPQRAYNYFCNEMENMLEYVFGIKEMPDIVGIDHTSEKIMLRNTIITAAHKVYLDKLFVALQQTGI